MAPKKKEAPKAKQKPQAAVSAWGDSNVMTMYPFGVTRTFEEKEQKSKRRISWMDDDDWELRARDEERGLGDVVEFEEDGSILDFRKNLQHSETFSHFYGSEKLKSQFEAKRREDERKLLEMLQEKAKQQDDEIPDYPSGESSDDMGALKERANNPGRARRLRDDSHRPKRRNDSESGSEEPSPRGSISLSARHDRKGGSSPLSQARHDARNDKRSHP